MEFLREYDFEVRYIQRKENVVVDALSQRQHEVVVLSLGVDLRENSWDSSSRHLVLGC